MAFVDNYKIRFANLATTSLRTELLRAQTLMRVKHGTGEKFPDIDTSKGQYFMLCLIDPWNNAWELVKVIEKLHGNDDLYNFKDTFKIVRAQEGTVAQYFPAAIVR